MSSKSSFLANSSDGLGLLELAARSFIVLAVAEDPEVAGSLPVSLDRETGPESLALLKSQSIHVELGHPNPIARMSKIEFIVRVDRNPESLQVLSYCTHLINPQVFPRQNI